MYNFMCEYTGVSSDMMVNGRVLRKGLKAMLENVPREDFLNILRAQENGWLKIHGNVTFGYANANKAIELYEKFANGTEKEIILAQLLRLAEENKNTFNKNNDLEKFAIKFKAKKVRVEDPKVEDPKVEDPKVEDPKVEDPKVEDPKVEDPKVEEPKVEEPKVEDPKVEEPKVEDPKVEEPKVEEPKVEEPKVEEPEVEEPEVDIEVESSTKSRKTKKVKKATED